MTTAQEEQHGPTALNWRLDALHAKVDQLKEEVILPVKETARAAMQGLKAAMASLADRGPDPDANPADEDMRTVMKAFVDMARYAQRNPNPGPGSINGMRSKLMDAVIWVILAVSAWNLKATIDNSRDIAVIQCQISPTCSQAVVRGKP